ncbi:MAG: DnaJ domain-containing protein [Kangiellaceae bacterium]|nr:DnaJ domain-containing protein [Kangiellaceae bacterium]
MKNIIIDFIVNKGGTVSEYQLLSYLDNEQSGFFADLPLPVTLYRKHFYLFHCLYKLRSDLIVADLSLSISPLQISILPLQESITSLTEQDQLSEFYLNLKNLELNEEEVNEMLNKFWQRYLALDQQSESIKTLGLENEADLNLRKIKKRYTQLALKKHPDRGGHPSDFRKIKLAYQELKKLYQN